MGTRTKLKSKNKPFKSMSVDSDLVGQPYYFPNITRQQAEEKLSQSPILDTYLIRKSSQQNHFALSTKHEHAITKQQTIEHTLVSATFDSNQIYYHLEVDGVQRSFPSITAIEIALDLKPISSSISHDESRLSNVNLTPNDAIYDELPTNIIGGNNNNSNYGHVPQQPQGIDAQGYGKVPSRPRALTNETTPQTQLASGSQTVSPPPVAMATMSQAAVAKEAPSPVVKQPASPKPPLTSSNEARHSASTVLDLTPQSASSKTLPRLPGTTTPLLGNAGRQRTTANPPTPTLSPRERSSTMNMPVPDRAAPRRTVAKPVLDHPKSPPPGSPLLSKPSSPPPVLPSGFPDPRAAVPVTPVESTSGTKVTGVRKVVGRLGFGKRRNQNTAAASAAAAAAVATNDTSTTSNIDQDHNNNMMAKELGLQTGDVMSRQRVFGVPLSNVPVDQNTKVPYIVFAICAHLRATALSTQGLFRHSGSVAEITLLRDAFESAGGNGSVDLTKYDTHTLTGTLKAFFRELSTPLIPPEQNDEAKMLMQLASASANDQDAVANMIVPELRVLAEAMPAAHYLTLRELVRLLKDVAQFSDVNKMPADNLITCIAPTLRCLPAFVLFGVTRYEEMFDDAKYAANEAAATRVRPTLPDKQIQRMSKISMAFDVNGNENDDDDEDEQGQAGDSMTDVATQSQAMESIAWTSRSGANETAVLALKSLRNSVKSFESTQEQSVVDTRFKTVRQFLITEEAYVAKLCQYVHSFIAPLRRVAAQFGLREDDLHTLNCHTDVIYKWHLMVLLELKKRIDIDKTAVISDVLTWIAPSDVYQVYTQHYDNAVAMFERLRRAPNEPFLAFVQQVKQKDAKFNTDLCAYLLCPVQRLQTYKDIMTSIVEATVVSHPERKSCERAVQCIERIFDYVNLGAQQALRRRQVEEISFTAPAATQTSWAERRGFLHKQGALNKMWKQRFFVLKNFKLFYYKTEQSAKPQGIIPLDDNTKIIVNTTPVQSFNAAVPHVLSITHHHHRVYHLAAADERTIAEWATALRNAVDAYSKLGGDPSQLAQLQAHEQQQAQEQQAQQQEIERKERFQLERRDTVLQLNDAELRLQTYLDAVGSCEDLEEQLPKAQDQVEQSIKQAIAQARKALEDKETQLLADVNAMFGQHARVLAVQLSHREKAEAVLNDQVNAWKNALQEPDEKLAVVRQQVEEEVRKGSLTLLVDDQEGPINVSQVNASVPTTSLSGLEPLLTAIDSLYIDQRR